MSSGSLTQTSWVPSALFSQVALASEDGMVVATARGEILYSSPALTRLLGQTEAQLRLRSALDLLHPEDLPRLAAALRDPLNQPVRQEARCLCVDGSVLWCELRIVPVPPEADRQARYIVFVEDVTERRVLQQQLRDSEARKAGILEASLDAIISMDDQGRVVEWNAAATRLFGYQPGEVLGQPMAELIIPQDQRPQHHAAVRRHQGPLTAQPGGRRVEVWAQRRGGEQFPCELTVSPVQVADQRYFTAAIRDLSELHQARQRAATQRRQLALITAQLPSISWTTDLDLILTSAQGGLIHELQINLQDYLGLGVAQALAGSPAVEQAVQVHRDALHGTDGSYSNHVFGRTFDIQVTAFRDAADQITGTLALAVDVTERTLAQRHEEDRAQVLESIARGRPLDQILTQIAALLEHQRPLLVAQVLVCQDRRLVLGAAPSLPDDARQLLTAGIPVGRASGTCALAAATATVTITTDIAADPCWITYAPVARQAGLQACWSVPLLAASGLVLGTLALYSGHPGSPDAATLALLNRTASLAAIAVEQAQQRATIALNREETLRALGLVLEYRDYETKGHTDRVVLLSMALAVQQGVEGSALDALRWGAYLHDVGKIAVPDHILLKPGKPTDEEWDLIRQHPQIGFELLRQIPALPPASLAVVLHHHERWDGGGYPHGLAGEAIPWGARLFSVVDIYDALTSARPYKAAWSRGAALDELRRLSGTALDPTLVDAFVTLEGGGRRTPGSGA